MANREFSEEDVAYIYNLLRQGTVKWSGRAECFRLARKKVLVRRAKSTGKPVHKWMYRCADPKCAKIWHRNQNEMEVDHIVEVGGVTSFNGDWNEMIARIYARPVGEKLQLLCLTCHMKKTKNFMNAAVQWVRKER